MLGIKNLQQGVHHGVLRLPPWGWCRTVGNSVENLDQGIADSGNGRYGDILLDYRLDDSEVLLRTCRDDLNPFIFSPLFACQLLDYAIPRFREGKRTRAQYMLD
ncbi:hypothetical protein D3C84_1046680 [compost metagenome]